MSDSPGRLLLLLLLPLPILLELLAEPARGREKQLAEADHDRPPEGIEQVGLKIGRHIAERVMDPGPAVEDVGDVDPERAAAQPGMLDRELGHFAEVGEQSQIEGADRRKMEIVSGERVHIGRALPIGAGARTPAVVRPAALRLNDVALPPAYGGTADEPF